MIAKAVATECSATFFSISASSLVSKYVGDSEKLVRVLFEVAREKQPSVIFMDEIDSILSKRSAEEHEASRRLKTEWLIQFDGIQAQKMEGERILVIGATNRPMDLDEAALRRLHKRIYVPLPDFDTRIQLFQKLLKSNKHSLSTANFIEISKLTDGYSCSDIRNLAADAAQEAVRELSSEQLQRISVSNIRGIHLDDFVAAMGKIRPSVSESSLKMYEKWNGEFGTPKIG
jgi:spastin